MTAHATPISPAAFAALSTSEQLRRVRLLAREALPLYGLPHDAEVKLLNYSENATFLVCPEKAAPRVLRINRPGYHPRQHIETELAWVKALRRDTPVITADVYEGLDGEAVQHIWHRGVPEPRNCVLMEYLPGTEPDDSNRLAAFELLGEVTARLHQHASSWKSSHPIQRHRWDFEAMLGKVALWGRWQDGLGMTAGKKRHLSRVVEALRPRIAAIGESRQRFGLVHADLRASNLLVHEGRVAVIDFDDTGFSWFIYDLAAALSFIETHPDMPAYIEAWLGGYRKVRSLSKAELKAIDHFIMLRRMLLVAWVGSHADTVQARAMGPAFTDETCALAERYLSAGCLR